MKLRKTIFLFSTIALLFGSLSLKAQEDSYAGGLLQNWAVGVDAGTYGFGIHGATSIFPHLKVRVGYDYVSYEYKHSISFDGPATDASGNPTPMELSGSFNSAKLKFPNAKILVDFYPIKTGIFSVTAGLYFGKNTVSAQGQIDNYNGTDYIDMQGFVIKPNPDGTLDADFTLGNSVKPYLGVGLGRTIPKHRLGFRFDLGLVFQGDYTFSSPNATIPGQTIDDITSNTNIPSWLLKTWPMLNFSLSYRITK